MNFTDVNYFAILVASLSSFMLGAVWYSKILFKNAWLENSGLTEQDLQLADPRLIFAGSFLLTFTASLVLALFLGQEAGIGESLGTGFAIGLFWVCSSLGLSYIFEQRPLKLFLINGSYYVMQFSLMGLILGLWP
ncbi:DUF1761 domain-containing protein [Pseudoalteromonas sp. MMG007]|uniref:DUF1761 domain-containing protein n=1 Tax=Pseudoalteromonas sp. MMG007 TaxID=2822684 RepID=UPI001B37FAB4|nr:DUF1761 domain-containing protein [Pseudoalteromonas sp. MMG007]MBQ4857645.1 DUF1761 domain-containing protein [Pseudoalteromonas sp. MMG007]